MNYVHRTCWTIAPVLAVALTFGAARPAWAALGGDVTTVQKDAVHMRASIRTTPAAAYTLHEISSGPMMVREYVSPQGKVFAVSWHGPILPDFSQLLGPYFKDFQQAVQARDRRIRGPVVVQTPTVVIESAGRMRNFTGRAYLPDSLPQGVDPRTIQ
jgi:hypothetical protein